MARLIRDFIPSDKDVYLKLSNEFYHSTAVAHPIEEECFERTFEACIKKSPYTRGLALILDDVMIGYAMLSFTWANEVAGLCVLLEELYVSPAYQGTGFGHAFFAFLDEEYQGKAKRYRLEVTPNNEGAMRLYRSMGFSELSYRQMVKDQ